MAAAGGGAGRMYLMRRYLRSRDVLSMMGVAPIPFKG